MLDDIRSDILLRYTFFEYERLQRIKWREVWMAFSFRYHGLWSDDSVILESFIVSFRQGFRRIDAPMLLEVVLAIAL